MAIEYLLHEQALNGLIADMPGVQSRVRVRAEIIGAKAKSFLDGRSKNRTGASQIVVMHNVPNREGLYAHLDSCVVLIDNAALSIEFGHHKSADGKWALTDAAGLPRTSGGGS